MPGKTSTGWPSPRGRRRSHGAAAINAPNSQTARASSNINQALGADGGSVSAAPEEGVARGRVEIGILFWVNGGAVIL
jgi:hypothetical protein